jgi:hypothetical protein
MSPALTALVFCCDADQIRSFALPGLALTAREAAAGLQELRTYYIATLQLSSAAVVCKGADQRATVGRAIMLGGLA